MGSGRHGISFEPGAFGGAWTLATCVELAALGIDRVFHWDIGAGTGGYDARQSVDAAGHVLFFSNAWVMAAARKLFGPSPAAKVSVLAAPTAQDAARGPASSGCSATTTASGIGGALPGGGAGVGLLLSVFNPQKSCCDPVAVSATFERAGLGGGTPALQVMVLNQTTSVYVRAKPFAQRRV